MLKKKWLLKKVKLKNGCFFKTISEKKVTEIAQNGCPVQLPCIDWFKMWKVKVKWKCLLMIVHQFSSVCFDLFYCQHSKKCLKITFGVKILICQLDGWRGCQRRSSMHRETTLATIEPQREPFLEAGYLSWSTWAPMVAGRQGEHEKLKTVVLHGKRTISHVSYLIFTFFGSARSSGRRHWWENTFFRAFPNQTRKIGENAIYIYIFLISLCFLLFLRNVYPLPREIWCWCGWGINSKMQKLNKYTNTHFRTGGWAIRQ